MMDGNHENFANISYPSYHYILKASLSTVVLNSRDRQGNYGFQKSA